MAGILGCDEVHIRECLARSRSQIIEIAEDGRRQRRRDGAGPGNGGYRDAVCVCRGNQPLAQPIPC